MIYALSYYYILYVWKVMPVCTHLSRAILWDEQVMSVQNTVLTPRLKWPPHRGGIRSPMYRREAAALGSPGTGTGLQNHVTPAAALPVKQRRFPRQGIHQTFQAACGHAAPAPHGRSATCRGTVSAAHSARPVPGSPLEELRGRGSPRKGSMKAQPREGSRLCWRAQVSCGAPHSGGADEGLIPGLPLISCLTLRK